MGMDVAGHMGVVGVGHTVVPWPGLRGAGGGAGASVPRQGAGTRGLTPAVPAGNLCGEAGAAERALEDAFLRRFLHGTFPGLLADAAVLKRRANLLVVCVLLARGLAPAKLHFLGGYAETLLSHFYKCPVRLELQTVPAKVPYKYL